MKNLFKNVSVQDVRDVKKRQRKRLDVLTNLKNFSQESFSQENSFASISLASSYLSSLSSLASSGFYTIFGVSHMCITIVA